MFHLLEEYHLMVLNEVKMEEDLNEDHLKLIYKEIYHKQQM